MNRNPDGSITIIGFDQPKTEEQELEDLKKWKVRVEGYIDSENLMTSLGIPHSRKWLRNWYSTIERIEQLEATISLKNYTGDICFPLR